LRDNCFMRADMPEDRLGEFERVVCYNTLPRVVAPVTISLVMVYAFCLLEAVLALAYGLAAQRQTWAMAGAWSLAGLIFFGLLAFFVRALLNDARRRYLLAEARRAPEAASENDTPDPFAGHLLFKRPAAPEGNLYACTSDEGVLRYTVELRRPHRHWRVCTGVDIPVFDVLAYHGWRSFDLFSGRTVPYRAGIYRDNALIAALQRQFSWSGMYAQVVPREGGEPHVYAQGGIYHRGRLVGRIYEIRAWIYLDIEAEHTTEGVLALYFTLE